MFAGVTYYNQLKQKANTWNIYLDMLWNKILVPDAIKADNI